MSHIYGIVPPITTPFDAKEEIIEELLRADVRHLIDVVGVHGLAVGGSTGEGHTLSTDELRRAVALTVEEAAGRVPVIAGIIVDSTRQAIEKGRAVADLDVAALQITPVHYLFKPTDEAMYRHFATLADVLGRPILIYNVTKFTHVNISAHAVGVLDKHPNIVGMKDSAGDVPQLVKFLDVVSEDFNLMVGTASSWYPALTLGITAGIMALANCAPNPCAEIQEAFEKGDHETARKIYVRMFPVNTAVTATYGVAGLKYACDLIGYEGGCVRSPLLPLKADEKAKVKEILKMAELI